MPIKTAGVGPFSIPTAPAVGTTVTSGAANAFTVAPVSFGNAPADLYITGVTVQLSSVSQPLYTALKILSAGNVVGILQGVLPSTNGGAGMQTGFFLPVNPPIPVVEGDEITVASADDIGALGYGVTLQCLAKADVVDDAVVAVAALAALVGAGGSGLTTLGDARLAHLDADISSLTPIAGAALPDNDIMRALSKLVNSKKR